MSAALLEAPGTDRAITNARAAETALRTRADIFTANNRAIREQARALTPGQVSLVHAQAALLLEVARGEAAADRLANLAWAHARRTAR